MLQEFLDADVIVIVIGSPMYNFTIASPLKAWIDRVAIAERTFHYSEYGPVSLAGGKRVIIASGRGSVLSGSPADFQEPYLRFMFGFFGIQYVEFVRAEGVALSQENRASVLNWARQEASSISTQFHGAA